MDSLVRYMVEEVLKQLDKQHRALQCKEDISIHRVKTAANFSRELLRFLDSRPFPVMQALNARYESSKKIPTSDYSGGSRKYAVQKSAATIETEYAVYLEEAKYTEQGPEDKEVWLREYRYRGDDVYKVDTKSRECTCLDRVFCHQVCKHLFGALRLDGLNMGDLPQSLTHSAMLTLDHDAIDLSSYRQSNAKPPEDEDTENIYFTAHTSTDDADNATLAKRKNGKDSQVA
ncbi:hypothetical protein CYMTET_38342 [Cymbomonas tetramitiformis]|uniref:SWIM-type domain-containing protein n=1 Tax=Cymbomonas tetramitiformis TaxID=36881 RepID=A0AAE0CEF9_9CHLO|nr:hypothetical protein CYMTET_38342 [Cymbomonas tetramitiformis]